MIFLLNYRFPSDPVRKEHWSRIIRAQRKEPYFKPHKNTRVCSVHFCGKDVDISKSGLRRLKVSAVPQLDIEVFIICRIGMHDKIYNSACFSGVVGSVRISFQLILQICENEEIRTSTPQHSSQVEEIDVDISDLNSIFDTPRKVKLKKKIFKLEKRQCLATRKIKSLQKQNARLKKKNKSLQDIIKDLKNKNSTY